MALSMIASEALKVTRTSTAGINNGRYGQSGARWTTNNAMTNTIDCSNQCTSAAPTDASGRISLGNHTLFTSWALPTTDEEPLLSALVKNVQGNSPQMK